MLRKIKENLKKNILFDPIWITTYKLKHLLEAMIKYTKFSTSDKWLDVGCGLRPYEYLFPEGAYIGVDIEESGRNSLLKKPDHYYDGRKLPFSDNSFDGVLNTQVLEHVPGPYEFLVEINRVIKPGGELILSLPFVWQEHEQPYDFFRFTQFGIVDLLKKSGFEVESIIKDSGTLETLAMILNVYIINNLVPRIRGFSPLINLLFCFPIQLFALALQRILPDRRELYLNLVIRARKIKK